MFRTTRVIKFLTAKLCFSITSLCYIKDKVNVFVPKLKIVNHDRTRQGEFSSVERQMGTENRGV